MITPCILPIYLLAAELASAVYLPQEAAVDGAGRSIEGNPHEEVLARGLLGSLGLMDGDESYAPVDAECPKDMDWILPADKLVKGEEKFLKKREKVVKKAVDKMMDQHKMDKPPRTPVIGYAISGGGYRAMITGLGGLMGLMEESDEAKEAGTGGWANAITYMAGLSGGSWGSASWIANGGRLPLELIKEIWHLEENLIFPGIDTPTFYEYLNNHVDDKRETKLPTQLTDYWGLALGDHLLPKKWRMDERPVLTISQLPQEVGKLGNGELPMPIVASQREEGEKVVAQNSTVWEFTPYSFGSWAFGSEKKVPGGFTPIEYLGTSLNDGKDSGKCWKGLDRLSFVMGTSATLFNGLLTELNKDESDKKDAGVLTEFLKGVLGVLSDRNFDVVRIPNPFRGWSKWENPLKDFENLTLVDAGETDQNIPLEPLLTPERKIDAIIAFDASRQTTTSWPNGSSIHATYERAHILGPRDDFKMKMPKVPNANGFINGRLNTRPTFFGCNETETPLLIYIPQSPWTYYSNKSTYKLDYDEHSATEAMKNGMRSMTLNNTVEKWPKCLSCALTDRAFNYKEGERPDDCQSCFDTFCWDGKDDDSEPKEYNPVLGVPDWLEEQDLVKSDRKDGVKGTNNWNDQVKSGIDPEGVLDWFADFAKKVGERLHII